MTDTLNTLDTTVRKLFAEDKFIEAGEVLEEAHRFAEASVVYEVRAGDNLKAASAAEQSNNYLRAASLYSSLEHTDLITAFCFAKGGLLENALKMYQMYQEKNELVYADLVTADIPVMKEASQKGQDALSSGDLNTALEQFELLVRKFPGHVDSRYSLSHVYQMLGEHEKAIEHLHVALGLNSEPFLQRDDVENMAIQLTHIDKQHGILPSLVPIVKETYHSLLYNHVFKKLYLQGDSLIKNTTLTTTEFSDTINTYKTENPENHLFPGLMYVRSGLYGDAFHEIAQLKGKTVDTAEARKQIQEESRAIHRTAVRHYREGKYEEAVRHYHLSMLLDPTNAWAFHDIGETYNKLGDEKHAQSFFTLAVNVDKTGKVAACLAEKCPKD